MLEDAVAGPAFGTINCNAAMIPCKVIVTVNGAPGDTVVCALPVERRLPVAFGPSKTLTVKVSFPTAACTGIVQIRADELETHNGEVALMSAICVTKPVTAMEIEIAAGEMFFRATLPLLVAFGIESTKRPADWVT